MKQKLMSIIAAGSILLSSFTINAKGEFIKNSQKFSFSGEKKSVETVMYKDENYLKLRDFAFLLMNKIKDFDVKYENKSIYIDQNKKYVPIGDELKGLKNIDSATVGSHEIILDGDTVLKWNFVNVDGYNYFRLRDMCDGLNLNCKWDKNFKEVILGEKMLGFNSEVISEPLKSETYIVRPLENGKVQIIYSLKVNSGGYSLTTKSVSLMGKNILITPELTPPSKDEMTTQVISYPTTAITIDNSVLPEGFTVKVLGQDESSSSAM